MDSIWEQLQTQFVQTWQKLNIRQKAIIFGSGIIIIITLVFLGRMAAKPEMVPLFTNLSDANAGAIISQLEDSKTTYQLTEGGSTILVPNKERDRLRIQLAMEDLPSGSVGFDSLNETRFGETDTDKRMRLLIALQGELTRTIESMEEIEAVRVHISIPEPKLFTTNTTDATASILVKLSPYSQLKPNQVLAIMRLVANSVEDLQPEQVAVVDTTGNILSDGITEITSPTVAKLTANQLQIKEHFENNLAKSVESMLERFLGYGSAVVRVSAELNFDEVERKTQTYGNNVLRSELVKEETSSGSSPIVGGVVDPGGAPVALDPSVSEFESTERIRNYDISVIEEYIKESPGAVNHLSVSVVVDTGEFDELDQNRKEKITSVVMSAAGIRLDRNDAVEVIGLPFDTKAFDQMQSQLEEYQRRQFIRQMVSYGIVAVFILITIGLVGRTLRARGKIAKQQQQFKEEVQQKIQLSPEEKERDSVRKQIKNLAKEKPSEVAQLLKTWLAEESR